MTETDLMHEIISIHAPLRGRRMASFCRRSHASISIHAPLRGRRMWPPSPRRPKNFNPRPLAGATHSPAGSSLFSSFQSTPPCGGDAAALHLLAGLFGISIHAPLRGRPAGCRRPSHWLDFNPRPLAGATCRSPRRLRCSICNFNPRPLAGATPFKWGWGFRPQDFNPRPLAGATADCPEIYRGNRFQSTPPCGGDLIRSLFLFVKSYFNPRPLAGATGARVTWKPQDGNFNPRPLAGATYGRSLTS